MSACSINVHQGRLCHHGCAGLPRKFDESGRRDSNPRPSPWQGDALPTEPRPREPHTLAVDQSHPSGRPTSRRPSPEAATGPDQSATAGGRAGEVPIEDTFRPLGQPRPLLQQRPSCLEAIGLQAGARSSLAHRPPIGVMPEALRATRAPAEPVDRPHGPARRVKARVPGRWCRCPGRGPSRPARRRTWCPDTRRR